MLQSLAMSCPNSPLARRMMARQAFASLQIRSLSLPGADPLHLMLNECKRRNLCDESGYRLPGVHWTFSVSVGSDDPMKPPTLRTIGIQRLCENGIDFVVKKGSASSKSFASGRPVSVLCLIGKYVSGEIAEQWRSEGHCEALPLTELIDVIPAYTLNAMLSSKRLETELQTHANQNDRFAILDNAHVHEVVQSIRSDLEDNKVDKEEVAKAIRAYRFHPDRVERMTGGPDSVLWDRWEWHRASSGNCPEGNTDWDAPKHLMPH